MIDEQLTGQLILGGGSLLTAYLTHKAATTKIRSSESVAFAQERTKLLERYEGQLETMNGIIDTLQKQNEELYKYLKEQEAENEALKRMLKLKGVD